MRAHSAFDGSALDGSHPPPVDYPLIVEVDPAGRSATGIGLQFIAAVVEDDEGVKIQSGGIEHGSADRIASEWCEVLAQRAKLL